jgi:Leucine-rich repeat (LRR) protein
MSLALHYSFRKIDHNTLCDAEQIAEESVEQVYLKFCDLVEFPEWVTRLQNLTHINISSNAIEEFPAQLNILANLNYLDVSDNRLTVLPPTVFELIQLRYLDVAGNFIEILPTGEHGEESNGSSSQGQIIGESIFSYQKSKEFGAFEL